MDRYIFHFYSHAPCGARHDCTNFEKVLSDFYSHAPCGARLRSKVSAGNQHIFLLTRPLRGATYMLTRMFRIHGFLLTRPLRGATYLHCFPRTFKKISTHTPLAGRDEVIYAYIINVGISTHTPLAGRDRDKGLSQAQLANFYSHAPCGARLKSQSPWIDGLLFLLTRPLRGATNQQRQHLCGVTFLLTRPLRGATHYDLPPYTTSTFLLTRPLRGATF